MTTPATDRGLGMIPVQPMITRLHPVAICDVRLGAGVWSDRQVLNAATIIPHCEEWMTRLGWVGNFRRAAEGTLEGDHRGREFADSEVYKLVEAMSWQHGRDESADLDSRIERLVDLIAAAQDDDGYLHTLFGRPGQATRYSDFVWGHELYCFGHLIQAAVARARTSADRRLLGVARRVADHVCAEFGPHGRNQVCGHAEIEMALVELYRVTGERSYLDQAALFIGRRGTGTLPLIEFGRAFYQDDLPVRDAAVLRGHAVRALYLAAGAVDVAVETGDDELLAALIAQWDATVARRTYLTGGMGSHHMDEAFGDDFVLPADRSYCETCAGVASIMFSWRLLLATGECRYADLIERTLYNVVATSPARDGRSFFYANTLHQRSMGTPAAMNDDGVAIRGGSSGREPWFEVSCCPPNVARTLASLSGYLATTDESGIQIHQYAPMRAAMTLAASRREIELEIETSYPADGRIAVRIVRTDGEPWSLTLRVPAWAVDAHLTVDGVTRPVAPGSVETTRAFRAGDVVLLELPITPRWTTPDSRIDAVRGCVAVERGPEVLCLESVDLHGRAGIDAVRIKTSTPPREEAGRVLVRLVRVERAGGAWPFSDLTRADERVPPAFDCALVAYNDWASRGPSTMRIWIPQA